MSQTETKRAKQKRNLLKILEKLFANDLKIVCETFAVRKCGTKSVLKQRIVELIESEKDFQKVRKEIRRVYKQNDKIKKSPKKGKKKKKKKKTHEKNSQNLQNFLANCVRDDQSESSESEVDRTPTVAARRVLPQRPSTPLRPAIPARPSMPVQRQSCQSVNSDNDLDLLDLNIFDNFQSTDSYSDSSNDQWFSPNQSLANRGHQSFAQTVNNALNAVNSAPAPSQPVPHTIHAPTYSPPILQSYAPQPPPDPSHHSTSVSDDLRSNFYQIMNSLRSNVQNYFQPSGVPPPNSAQTNPMHSLTAQTPHPSSQTGNMVFNHNPPVLRPVPSFAHQQHNSNNNFNNLRSTPLDFSIRNNYFPNSGPQNSHPFHPNYNANYNSNCYQSQMNAVNSMPETDMNLDMDALIEQQKFILSQFPNSFQDSERNSDCDGGVAEVFTFKALPKFKVIKTLIPTQTLSSLSDIGTQVDFNVVIWDLDPSYPTDPVVMMKTPPEIFRPMLDRKSLRIVLRFGYVAEIKNKEHKDLVPEHLCVDCNEQRIFSYDDNEENDIVSTVPIDLSDYCRFGRNRVRFSMSKANYTFLMPCIYEICLVEVFTPDKYYEHLKNNADQFLSSDFTIRLIKALNDQLSADEAISVVNSDIRLKLICPLSCQRIAVPIRTIDCKHIECFDAFSFLKANESRYDWLCPICQKCAHFDKLRIDGYVKEILSSTEKTNSSEVFVKSDATYDLKQSQNESEVIDLDDSTLDSEVDISEVSVVDADGCIVLD